MKSFLRRFLAKKEEKIEVFSRHALFSKVSAKKKRPPHFSRKVCFENLLDTLSFEKANLTLFLDVAYGPKEEHFLHEETRFPLIEIEEGTEAGAFLRLLDYVKNLKHDPDTILYFVEDDYLHKRGWVEALLEAFSLEGVEYVTLYDHRDKYFATEYQDLYSKIYLTQSCYWRTTPSTTQTFAVRFKTLLRDLALHQKYSEQREISGDHEKFCHIRKRGEVLVSAMPGLSTHVEPAYFSPFTDWEDYFLHLKEPV